LHRRREGGVNGWLAATAKRRPRNDEQFGGGGIFSLQLQLHRFFSLQRPIWPLQLILSLFF